jgi:hypothetical protein
MRKLYGALTGGLIAGALWFCPAVQGQISTQPSGQPQGNFTNTTASVANSDTTITLTKASRHVIIKTDPAAAIIYVDLNSGTATTADFRIEPGGALTYEGEPVATFHYIGATATGTISVMAW